MSRKYKKPKCKFVKICESLYGKGYQNYCILLNSKKPECKLIQDVKKGNVTKFVISLLQKESGNKSLNDFIDLSRFTKKVTCPRSIDGKIKLTSRCSIIDCPFYSEKVVFNCILIHSNIFFPNYKNIPVNILEVGLAIDRDKLQKMINIGIYLSRMIILLVKYQSEIGENIPIKLLFIKNRSLQICPICQGVFDTKLSNECSCIDNNKLRKRRRKFVKNWRALLKLNYQENKKLIKDELFNVNDSMSFIKAHLHIIQFQGLKFNSVPFGYLFNSYHILFKESKTKIAESFGLSRDRYNIGVKLFLLDKEDKKDGK